MSSEHTQISRLASERVEAILKKLRYQKLVYSVCYGFGIGLALSSLLSLVNVHFVAFLLVLFSVSIATSIFVFKAKITRLSQVNVIAHLNKHFSELEESAALFFNDVDAKQNDNQRQQTSILAEMQRDRIAQRLKEILSKPDEDLALPKTKLGNALVVVLLGMSMNLLALAISDIQLDKPSDSIISSQASQNAEPTNKVLLNPMSQLLIEITPPSYTQMKTEVLQEPNLKVVQGSSIEWMISETNSVDAINAEKALLQLRLGNGETAQKLATDSQSKTSLTLQVNQSTLYQFIQLSPSNTLDKQDNEQLKEKLIAGPFSIETIRDTAPRIRILSPRATLTTFPKDTQPIIETEVLVSDDFGLTDVTILASIAKGSGEAVKFRDEVFTFDSFTEKAKNTDESNSTYLERTYKKTWRFEELDMEPGDELYFSVQASDNYHNASNQPSYQSTRSETKIIRWLEDEEAVLGGEGILIDFEPEYFKSQRQIIIETKQLIQDKPFLSETEFDLASRGLGNDQSDLKQRYGQYLGDEFETGVLQSMEAASDINIKGSGHEHDHHDEHDDHDKAHNESSNKNTEEHSHEHDHGHAQSENSSMDDRSGYAQIIDRFGHNHGQADIGFIKLDKGMLSPKVLMKQAIAQMWQAELHLRLSQPELALPFEEEALDYLNRAKKAERIYVKRLGFEPPPVSEERRYQAKLTDILENEIERSLNNEQDKDLQQTKAISALLSYINVNKVLYENANETRFDISKLLKHIESVKEILTTQLEEKPQLIVSLATLERLALNQSLALNDCENCLNELIRSLWQIIPAQEAAPFTKQSQATNSPLTQAYSDFLRMEKRKSLASTYNQESGRVENDD
jgi:hypothetical protein